MSDKSSRHTDHRGRIYTVTLFAILALHVGLRVWPITVSINAITPSIRKRYAKGTLFFMPNLTFKWSLSSNLRKKIKLFLCAQRFYLGKNKSIKYLTNPERQTQMETSGVNIKICFSFQECTNVKSTRIHHEASKFNAFMVSCVGSVTNGNATMIVTNSEQQRQISKTKPEKSTSCKIEAQKGENMNLLSVN